MMTGGTPILGNPHRKSMTHYGWIDGGAVQKTQLGSNDSGDDPPISIDSFLVVLFVYFVCVFTYKKGLEMG